MEALLKKIDQLNNEVKKINNEATKEIGRRDEIKRTLTELVNNYNTKYPQETPLSIDDMETVRRLYAVEMDKKNKEADTLAQVVQLIYDKKYMEAHKVMGLAYKPKDMVAELPTNEELPNFTQELKNVEVNKKTVATGGYGGGGFKLPNVDNLPNSVGEVVAQPQVVEQQVVQQVSEPVGVISQAVDTIVAPITQAEAQYIKPAEPTFIPNTSTPTFVPEVNVPSLSAPTMTTPSMPTVDTSTVVPVPGVPSTPVIPAVPTMPAIPTMPIVPTSFGVQNPTEVAPVPNIPLGGAPFVG